MLTFTKHENHFFFHYHVGHGPNTEFHVKSRCVRGTLFRDNDT